MAITVYFTSIEPAGKTAFCIGIGKDLQARGKKVGYFIPFRRFETRDTEGYLDASFGKDVLNLKETVEQMAPIHLAPLDLWQSLTEDTTEFMGWVINGFSKIARDKDFVMMEGMSGFAIDTVSNLACYRIADAIDARIVVILRYSSTLNPDNLQKVKEKLGQKFIGVIINNVPENSISPIKRDLTPQFLSAGVPVLGFIPEVHSLLSITVNELAKSIDATKLPTSDQKDNVIENIMLGAMTPDSGIDYFNRKNNKAVIIKSDRADLQLAAMETSTSCLVLTGTTKPLESVIYQAENKNIPILTVSKTSEETIQAIEQALANNSFNNSQKMKIFIDTVTKYLDFSNLYAALGIKF